MTARHMATSQHLLLPLLQRTSRSPTRESQAAPWAASSTLGQSSARVRGARPALGPRDSRKDGPVGSTPPMRDGAVQLPSESAAEIQKGLSSSVSASRCRPEAWPPGSKRQTETTEVSPSAVSPVPLRTLLSRGTPGKPEGSPGWEGPACWVLSGRSRGECRDPGEAPGSSGGQPLRS